MRLAPESVHTVYQARDAWQQYQNNLRAAAKAYARYAAASSGNKHSPFVRYLKHQKCADGWAQVLTEYFDRLVAEPTPVKRRFA